MVDLGSLTDDQLKAELLQYGVKAGPIVASTRALYKQMLKRLMDSSVQTSQHWVNGTGDARLYSDSEGEAEREEDEDSESVQLRSGTVSRTEMSKTASEADKEEAADMVDLGSLTDDQLKAELLQYGVKAGPIVASTRALYEQMLKRLMDSSVQTSQHWVNGTGDARLYSDSEGEAEREEDEDSESVQLRSGTVSRTEMSKTASEEPVMDVLSEMFSDTAKNPTGIYATKRRPIKGAAGRPVQFKYPKMPLLSPATLERQEIQQRLVPVWVQIVVFLLVVCLLYLIYSSMEEPLSKRFTALISTSQDSLA